MRLGSVHRKYFKMSLSSAAPLLLGAFLVILSCSVTVAEPQFTSSGFIDTEQDLLAMPSDPHPVHRSGPITQYAFDSVPVESQQTPVQQAAPAPQEDNVQVASNLPTIDGAKAEITGPAAGPIQSPSGIPPFVVDGHVPLLPAPTAPAFPLPQYAPAVPVALGHPTTVFVPDAHHAVAVPHLGFLDIYHDILAHPHKALTYITTFINSFPRDHYLNVISFVGIYLFMSYMLHNTDDVFQLTCEVTGGNRIKGPHKEWAYHAGRRFVPALPVDRKMQKKFYELFRGPHLEGDNSGSSSEESGEINHIQELYPKNAFFYSLAPNAIDAWTQLQRLFVAQRTPADVLSLAKHLLYQQKVHPKIWYLGLLAAANERPDMTGFQLAHPLDAIPDWFLPAHLIKDEFDRYRSITLERQGDRGKRIKRGIFSKGNSTFISIRPIKIHVGRAILNKTTTIRPASTTDSSEMSGEFVGLDGSPITKKGDDADSDDSGKLRDSNRGGGKGKGKGHGPGLGHGKGHGKEHGKKGHGKGHGKGDGHKKGKGKGHGKGKGGKGKGDDCIVVDGHVGRDNGIENKLWYWREDLMLNQHHWYWHQAYPLNATRHPDRRAELFFYMHRAFTARYDSERLSNGLPRTHEMDFQPGGIIHDGYNSHLADLTSGKWWAPRPAKLPLTDIMHLDNPVFSRNILLPDVMETYHRLLKAAKSGKMITRQGKIIPIQHTQGIEPFSNTVEASELSVNPIFYDTFGLHNTGHMLLGLATDPFFKLHIPPGPMAEQAMSMRDPVFYPYHLFIDNLFERFKATLPPYKVIGGEYPLLWRGVEVHQVEIVSKGHHNINHLRTFWTDRKFDLSPGVERNVDIGKKDQAKVCAVHLAHEPFLFKIAVERKACATSRSGKGTVRIFMAPRFDEKGRRLHMREQRRLMFQLDSFPVKLRVGRNIITRRSHDSSLTKPWDRSLNEMEEMGADPSGAAAFCGCGWPQHLYIPKGSPDGMLFDLFVMITNYDDDRVLDNPKDLRIPEPCNSPHIFCGHPRRRYPDAKPMGYPFDRPLCRTPVPCFPGHSFGSMVCRAFNLAFIKPVETLEQFVSKAPNMRSTVFTIKHIDHFVGNHRH